MIKEEKELRRHLGFLKAITTDGKSEHKITMALITALVHAVREDAVNKATTFLHGADYRHSNEDWLLKEIAAAIRGKK